MIKSKYKYYLSLLLSQINPITISQSIQQTIGQVRIILENGKSLPNANNYVNKVSYNLPFDEEWLTVKGGTNKENSHSWNILTQRYAYDFVIVDNQGISYKNEGKNLDDYYCFKEEVLSPANGVVVELKNNIKDYEKVGDFSIDWKTKDFRGNYLIIRHAMNEYSFIAHFNYKSIRVKKGETVERGQIIGLCGNSGHSTEPHIHFHLQNNKNFWTAAGLPIRFNNVSRKINHDTKFIENSFIEKKEKVKNLIQNQIQRVTRDNT